MPNSAPRTATDRLDALLDAAVDAIVLIDPQARITRFNRAAERLFGYTAAEVLGHNVNMLMPAPYREEHDGYMSRFLSTGERRIIGIGREVIARRRDGSLFPIDLSVGEFRTVPDAENGTEAEHGFVGILRDISDRQRQNSLLRQSAEELRLLFEHAPTAIVVCDPDGHIQNANAACLQLLGYELAQINGTRLSDLVEPDDRPLMMEDFRQQRSGADTRQRELRIRHRLGHSLPVLHYSGCARNSEGRIVLYIAELIDRSALQAATLEAANLRERLAHAGRVGMLGEMVSGIAHEVNQPLTAINNYASACRRMIASGQASPADLADVLEKISRQAERAGQVIRGLRAMIRQRQTAREVLDLNALVEEVSRLVEADLRSTAQRLELALAPDLPAFIGDGVQIQQVLMNLIRNGLEAMRDSQGGEEVRVHTRLDADGRLSVAVSDQGPGLSPEVEARLFDPFVTTKTQGMGLGLSISKSIVHAHGGELTYRRGAHGGAEFTVRLPAAQQEDEG